MRFASLVVGVLLAVTVVFAAKADPPARPSHRLPNPHQTQLLQIDQLIQYGYHSRAQALLEDLTRLGVPEDALRRRRIRIAAGTGNHDQVIQLAREALSTAPDDAGIWRELAAALFAQEHLQDGRTALTRFLTLTDEPRTGFTVAVDLLEASGLCALATSMADSARGILGEPGFLARQRARCLLELGRSREAALEVLTELRANPFNLQLLRQDLLDSLATPASQTFYQEILRLAGQPQALPELMVFAANLAVARGQSAEALDLIQSAPGSADFARAVLQNAGTLTRELRILAGDTQRRAFSDYLLSVLEQLTEHPRLPLRQRQRAADDLAESCLFALENGFLDDDPQAAAAVFGRKLALVRKVHPESSHLYSAQIQLARFSRDHLRDPLGAAARLEHLIQDLDLSLEGLALARLTLGECYLAARDTVRARSVLTALGRDPDFRAPAGHAHFLLAKLDLAQGHFVTARDRFAAAALDNPAAAYANDALALGLLVAEELLNPTGGMDLLARYARSIWWQIAAEPDSQRVSLEKYIERAARQVDQTQQQTLLEHARLDLSGLYREAGRYDEALAQLERIVLDLPHGRQAARALALRAEMFAEVRSDSAAARREYERLLVQYPDYLFATEVRQKLRSLP
jgi:tetratricopeptide (TPR) repeat protein